MCLASIYRLVSPPSKLPSLLQYKTQNRNLNKGKKTNMDRVFQRAYPATGEVLQKLASSRYGFIVFLQHNKTSGKPLLRVFDIPKIHSFSFSFSQIFMEGALKRDEGWDGCSVRQLF